MNHDSPKIIKSRQSLPIDFPTINDILVSSYLHTRLPPRPVGDTYDPRLDIRECSLGTPPMKVLIPTSSPEPKIKEQENPATRKVVISSVPPNQDEDFFDSNENLIEPNNLSKSERHHHHHHKKKKEDPDMNIKARQLSISQRRRVKTSSYVYIPHRKNPGALDMAQKKQMDLENTNYPPVTVDVPPFSFIVWKYPSHQSCGTAMCPIYQKFVSDILKTK